MSKPTSRHSVNFIRLTGHPILCPACMCASFSVFNEGENEMDCILYICRRCGCRLAFDKKFENDIVPDGMPRDG